jgi:Homeodomain-like domain-containing protein
VFGAIAHFERRLIAERTKAAARARGKRLGRQPIDADKVQAALKLVEAGLSPTKAASQLGLGRSTVYREVAAAGLSRSACRDASAMFPAARTNVFRFRSSDPRGRKSWSMHGRSKTADDSELHHEWTVPIGELKSINLGSSAQQNPPYILEAAVRFTFSVIVSQLTNVALPSCYLRRVTAKLSGTSA